MRAVLDYSWHSLSEAEQDAFRRLSVFRGGFTREAAQVVAGALLPILASLVDKSWLQHDSSEGRYGLHELLGQYAREQLEQSGLAEQTFDAHMHYYADFMRVRETGIKYRRQSESLAEIERDFENVRLAWKRGTVCGDYDAINQMSESLNFFCDMRARFNEGVALFTYAGDAFAPQPSREAVLTFIRLRARRARLVILGAGLSDDDLNCLVEKIETHVKAAREYQSLSDIAFLLHMLGVAKSVICDFESALTCFSESLDIYTELNDPFYMAENLVWVGLSQDDFSATDDYFRRALVIQQDIDDQNGMAWTLMDLARTAFSERYYVEAQHYLAEATAIQRRRRDLKGLHNNLILSSQSALRMGDFDTALALAQESAEIAGNLNIPPVKQASKMVIGVLHIVLEIDVAGGKHLIEEALAIPIPKNLSCGDPELDATLGMFVAAFINGDLDEMRCQYAHMVKILPDFSIQNPINQFELLVPLATMLLASDGEHEGAVELLAFSQHLSSMSENPVLNWSERLPLTIRLHDDLRQRLDNAVYEVAWQRGKSLDLQKTVHNLMNRGRLSEPSETLELVARTVDSLTERELEVLNLVAEGLSNREIATRLYLALGTVKWYISEVYGKLGVTSRTQAVARARELQLIA
jgi:DNA-binding CsgD family transcriptional regulator/tetratricopeptide (TPR) repeat protein